MMTGRRTHFPRALFAALSAFVISVWLVAPAHAQPATAHVSVAVPAVPRGSVAMLDLSINAQASPAASNLGGIVWLRRPGGAMMEVGRFSVFGAAQQSYQFDVTAVLQELRMAGSQADIEVALIYRGSGAAANGTVTIGRAAIVTR